MSKHKTFLIVAIAMLVIAAGFVLYRVHEVNLAHTTFERYYAFRGCTQLIDRTDTYGDCRLANGQSIKIVLYEGKWYLDGDLPARWGNFTF
jgi:hypothetical protein